MTIHRAHIHMLRGPLVVTAAAASFLLPYFLELSQVTLLQLTLALFGILWLCYDLLAFLEQQTRSNLRTLLNSLVLDDLLRLIYDPETGLIANMVGTFVGASSMYALGMSDEQRTKLVQASLLTSSDEARTVLLSPGGCKLLLPESMQTWLEEDEGSSSRGTRQLPLEKPDMEEEEEGNSDTSASESARVEGEDNSISSDEASFRERGIPDSSESLNSNSARHASQSRCSNEAPDTVPKESRTERPSAGLIDPVTMMISIMKELAFERMTPLMKRLPAESTLENVGTAAAFALALQISLRLRSKRSLLSSISALTLGGVATTAFSTILAKHAVLGNIQDKESLQLVAETIAMRIWKRLKSSAMTKVRWQGILAMVVLTLVGRRRRPDTTHPFRT